MKFNKTTIFILSVLLLQGCELEKRLLTVDQIGKSTTATFYSDMGGFLMSIEGTHANIRDFVDDNYLRYGDLRGDLLYATLDADEGALLAFNYELTAEHVATYPHYIWTQGWTIVQQANDIIYYAPIFLGKNPNLTADQKATMDKILAQAHFARAFAHFCICNCYAWPYNHTADHSHLGIPVMDHVARFDEKVPRKSVGDVYKLIFSDMAKARAYFKSCAEKSPSTAEKNAQINSISDCYHISDIACEALLARIYLYIEDWDNAATCAKNVMDKVSLTPHDDYVNMFRSSQACHGAEAILRMDSYNSTTSMASFFDPPRTPKFIPDASVYAMFDEDDVRAKLLSYEPLPSEDIYKPGLVLKGVCKYSYDRTITDSYKQVSDCFVLRASEMYLIYAEAVLKSSGNTAQAENCLKALIGRAKNVDASEVSLSYSGVDGLLELVEFERKRELCFEGHRFYDILRQGQDINRPETSNSTLKNLAYPDYRYLLPIDRMECQFNEVIQQNEGYDDYKH